MLHDRMCGTRLVDRNSSADLRQGVGIDRAIEEVILQNRLRWYGHVLSREINNSIRQALQVDVRRKRSQERPKKTWMNCVTVDMKRLRLMEDDALDRNCWRNQIKRQCQPLPARINGIKTDVVVVFVTF